MQDNSPNRLTRRNSNGQTLSKFAFSNFDLTYPQVSAVGRALLTLAFLILLSVSLQGCKDDDADQTLNTNPKISPDLNFITELQLKSRFIEQDGRDNFLETALFLTQFDRNRQQAVAYFDRIYHYSDEADFTVGLFAVCENETECGIKKMPADVTIQSLTKAAAEAIPAAERMGAQTKAIDRIEYTAGSLWLVSVRKVFEPTKDVWEKLIAIELISTPENAAQITIRYKVLKYEIVIPATE